MLIFCAISLRFQQPSNYDTNSKFKAVFIYNFTRYFEWSEKKKADNFVIYVVGKNENLITELKTLASKKKVGNQDIEIKNSYAFDPGISSNITYLLSDVSKSIKEVTSLSKSKSTLVVCESPNACKAGSSINFVVVENKLKFEYSKNNAVKAGLKTNDDIKALAINIE
ncbi:MAG: YfiR family protein [Bacteroidota bacterium]|nr:YfiR family protein [Bacteroidota bacterium]MDP3145628.1 YfiR family protein [Bacteroidota bacterium]MDP3558699.1 YfiR family protein [Bacteroidota bacterium]